MLTRSALTSLACASLVAFARAQNSSVELPVVDLGYQLQRASAYSDEHQIYNFSNIRFAAPPLGDLRWRLPQTPAVNRTAADDGLTRRACPQANPAWQAVTAEFVPQYLLGQNISVSPVNTSNFTPPPRYSIENEDCLFLDVFTPKEIYENAGKGYGAPVLVWIYGGGYTAGTKDASGGPAGLIERSFAAPTTGGVIYVAMNYRLGAFGWASGPTLQSDGTANLGLYDQRFALEWVQQHISKFGGDPKRVTVFGESAGGGSIMHQITAYGGNAGPAPFQQAIPQSPGWVPTTSTFVQEQTFQKFLEYANVSSLEEARDASTDVLMTANALQIGRDSLFGQFTYTPVVDGNFVPALPGQLLLWGQFDKSVRVMVSHNGDEGLLFTNPFLTNGTAVRSYFSDTFPNARPEVIDYIDHVLYPPVFNGSYPYTNQIARLSLIVSEFVFTCNTNYLGRAYGNETYSYYFTVPPATHGSDIVYTYYGGNDTAIPSSSTIPVQNVTVAYALQEWITSFAQLGRPVGPVGTPLFKMYGADAGVVEVNGTDISTVMDPTANARCLWWQKALYS